MVVTVDDNTSFRSKGEGAEWEKIDELTKAYDKGSTSSATTGDNTMDSFDKFKDKEYCTKSNKQVCVLFGVEEEKREYSCEGVTAIF